MNELPEKIFSQYPPTIIDTSKGRYVVYEVGNGWYPVDAEFTIEDAMKRWEQKRPIELPSQEPDAPVSTRAQGKKIVIHVDKVTSASDPSKSYEVLRYDDDTYSCNCPSWVFKNKGTDDNSRHCKHIDKVKSGDL